MSVLGTSTVVHNGDDLGQVYIHKLDLKALALAWYTVYTKNVDKSELIEG